MSSPQCSINGAADNADLGVGDLAEWGFIYFFITFSWEVMEVDNTQGLHTTHLSLSIREAKSRWFGICGLEL